MSIMSLIKKHDIDSLTTTDELTFVYPFIVPKATNPKLVESLRSFMMIQYLSQIKITNAIKVTTSLARPKQSSNIPKVDATKFQTNISTSNYGADLDPRPIRSGFSVRSIREDVSVDLTKQEYIDKFRAMLQHMVKTEPRFRDLDPIVTTVTLENLLTIPVIAASKVENISNDILYWILFAAMGQNIRIDSVGSLNRIESVLRAIPAGSYSELLDPEFLKTVEKNNARYQKDAQETNRLNFRKEGLADNYSRMIRDPLDFALNTWGKVLDVKQWDDRTGVKTSVDDKLSASSISTLGSSQAVLSKSNTLFASLISNYVLNLLQSTIHALVSDDEIDTSRIISNFGKGVIEETNHLVSSLLLGMLNSIQTQSITSSDVIFKQLESSCVANASINISNMLTSLDTLGFSVRGDTSSLADFTSGLVSVATKMSPLSSTVEGFISSLLKFGDSSVPNLTGSDIDSSKIIESYRKNIEDRLHKDVFGQLGISSSITKVFSSSRFTALTNNINASKFINNVSTAISEITQFLAIYTFYSYFCEYTGELAAEVEVKRQGVMSFPNYCLVVPIEMIRPIYAVLGARNFKSMIEDPSKFDNDVQIAGRVSEFKLVSVIKEKLAIQNIMVIDSAKKTIYYKWMFSSSVQKISSNSLDSYVKTQTEFLKAY